MPRETWGGARVGAGRPRSTLYLKLPPLVIQQFEEIAEAEQTTLDDVIRTALLDWLSEWQDQHDRTVR